MSSRNETIFCWTAPFEEIIDGYSIVVSASIVSHLQHFEKAWHASRHDGELPDSFCFEAYKNVCGPYRLVQIRVGPGHGYRAVSMFPDGRLKAYWVYAFKKTRQRQQSDMDRAHLLAQQHWDEIKGER